jgi:hypothetical protein
VKYPSPTVVGDCLLVCILRTVSKVLPKPGDRYSRGSGSRHGLRKPSAEEGLHRTPPTVRPALASDWTISDTETKKLLSILQCHCHLTIRKVETMSFRPPPTEKCTEFMVSYPVDLTLENEDKVD